MPLIILCNGQAKSGSSFVHQVVENMVEASGFDQKSMRKSFLPPSTQPYPPHPHYAEFEEGQLQEVWENMEEDGVMVVKTHSPLRADMVDLLNKGRIKALFTYRNPRDAAVSLFEAGRAESGKAAELRRFPGVDSRLIAIRVMANRVGIAAHWLQNSSVLKIDYEDISCSFLDVVREIKTYLDYDGEIMPVISSYLRKKQKIREYNVGVSGRYVTNLDLLEEGWSNIIFRDFDKLTEKQHGNENFLF